MTHLTEFYLKDRDTSDNAFGTSPEDMKQGTMSIASDLDSGYQEISLEQNSTTQTIVKDSQVYSDGEVTDKDRSDEDIEDEGLGVIPKIARENNTDELTKMNIEKLFGGEIAISENYDQLDYLEKRRILKKYCRDHLVNLPEALATLSAGALLYGDCGRSPEEIPEWLDREKFARGQRFAMDHLFGVFFAELLSLFVLYSFEDGLKPMMVTGKSAEPYTAFKRFLSTGSRVRNWYTTDIWEKGTAGHSDIQVVRKMHEVVRSKLYGLTNEKIDDAARINTALARAKETLIEDFKAACPAAMIGQCPYASENYRANRPKGINQTDMVVTQWGFIGLVILYPKSFGIHNASDDDLDALCHVWRGIGYRLGIDEEYNFCQGTLEEIKQRSRDILEYWAKPNLRQVTPEWEHMMRCVTIGLDYYSPGLKFESALLYLTEIMGMEMPRLKSSMNIFTRMKHQFATYILHYLCRFAWIQRRLNKKLNRRLDRAQKFTERKHAQLKELSEKTLRSASTDNEIKIKRR